MFTEMTSNASRQVYLSVDDVTSSFDGMLIDFSVLLPAIVSDVKGIATNDTVKPLLCGGGGSGGGGGGGGGAC